MSKEVHICNESLNTYKKETKIPVSSLLGNNHPLPGAANTSRWTKAHTSVEWAI